MKKIFTVILTLLIISTFTEPINANYSEQTLPDPDAYQVKAVRSLRIPKWRPGEELIFSEMDFVLNKNIWNSDEPQPTDISIDANDVRVTNSQGEVINNYIVPTTLNLANTESLQLSYEKNSQKYEGSLDIAPMFTFGDTITINQLGASDFLVYFENIELDENIMLGYDFNYLENLGIKAFSGGAAGAPNPDGTVTGVIGFGLSFPKPGRYEIPIVKSEHKQVLDEDGNVISSTQQIIGVFDYLNIDVLGENLETLNSEYVKKDLEFDDEFDINSIKINLIGENGELLEISPTHESITIVDSDGIVVNNDYSISTGINEFHITYLDMRYPNYQTNYNLLKINKYKEIPSFLSSDDKGIITFDPGAPLDILLTDEQQEFISIDNFRTNSNYILNLKSTKDYSGKIQYQINNEIRSIDVEFVLGLDKSPTLSDKDKPENNKVNNDLSDSNIVESLTKDNSKKSSSVIPNTSVVLKYETLYFVVFMSLLALLIRNRLFKTLNN